MGIKLPNFLTNTSSKFWYSLMNYGGVMYTLGTIISLFVFNAYFTCPILETDRCPYYIGVGVFFLFEIFLNFFCFHYYARFNRVDFIFPKEALPEGRTDEQGYVQIVGDPETTKFCFNCRRSVPIRSHHCPLCRYCVLKKDHHCFLTGGCVGFGNQRYFVVFLFWASIGALYGAWITGRYLNRYFKPFWPLGFVDYIFPICFPKWMVYQHCTIVDLGFVVMFSAGIGGGMAALIFFGMQMRLITKGQTMFEMMNKDERKLHPERMPWNLRMQCVFGPYWAANFLIPLPWRNRMDEEFRKILYECCLKEM